MAQNLQMKLLGALGSPGCEDLEVTILRKGKGKGQKGKIWCYNRRICTNPNSVGGKGRYVIEVDLKIVRNPRSRSYISHLFATLTGTEHQLSPDMLLKRMQRNKEIQSHVPWLSCWSLNPTKANLILNRIAGILTPTKYQEMIAIMANEKKIAMAIDLGDHPDDDEDDLALKRNKRAKRRREEMQRQEKAANLAVRLEESSEIYIGLREFLLFARESELGRPPTLLSLLAADFKVKAEEEETNESKEEKQNRRICVLRRRLGYQSKKKYALLRWKGLAPPQPHNKILYETVPNNIIVSKKSDPHPHPSNPKLRIAILLTDPVHLRSTVYVMKRVAHKLRIQIYIKQCPSVEILVTELVNHDPEDSKNAINLVFLQDNLPGLASDQLKRSLELAKVAVPTVMVTSPETTPPSYLSESGQNHQLPLLVNALEHDPLQSKPGHFGPGNESTQEVPWTILCLPFTGVKIQTVFTSFWLPLQHRSWRLHTAQGDHIRPPPPNAKNFLGKSASETLSFQHKSGLGRDGICTWYASTQNDIIRNVPSIEKQWMLDADNSLKRGAAPLNFGKTSSRNKKKEKQNVLFSRRVAVQKKQIARRMQEHITAQSKIVLNLLPSR